VSCVTAEAEDTLGVGEVPSCLALVKHYGGKENHQLLILDFSWGSPRPPYGPSPRWGEGGYSVTHNAQGINMR
jgi:hypothetical protein